MRDARYHELLHSVYDADEIAPSVLTAYYGSNTLHLNKGTYYIRLEGSSTDGLTYSFTPSILPASAKISSVVSTKESFTVKWDGSGIGADRYELRYSAARNMASSKQLTMSGKESSRTVTGLKDGATYYAQIRVVKTIGGKEYRSDWSSVKPAKTLAKSATLKDVLEQFTNQKVFEIEYIDKAKSRAIAVTASRSSAYDYGYKYASIWLVKADSAEEIYTSHKAILRFKQQWDEVPMSWLVPVKGGKLFKVEEGSTGGPSSTLIWLIRGNRLKRVAMNGFAVKREGSNSFSSISSRGYIRYYYKWNGSKFVERGGREISPAKLKNAKNGRAVLSEMSKQFVIRKAYYHDNGIIDVNVAGIAYSGALERQHVVLRYRNGRLSYVSQPSWRQKTLEWATLSNWCETRSPGKSKVTVSYPTKLPKAFKGTPGTTFNPDKLPSGWYRMCFTPEDSYSWSSGYREICGTQAIIDGNSIITNGGLHRGSSLKKLRTKPTTLARKTRLISVSGRIKFRGTSWREKPRYIKRKQLLSMVASWNRNEFGTLYFKYANGKIKEVRCAAA